MSSQQLFAGANNARRGIVAAGSWIEDRIKVLEAWPQEEHITDILEISRQGGGSGHNLGVDIRRLDAAIPVEAIGLLGADEAGDFLVSRASLAGIDTSQLARMEGVSTPFTDVMSDSQTGKRTFFFHRGTNDFLTPEHFDFSNTRGAILHLGLLGVHKMLDDPWQQDANGWVAVLKSAREHGLLCNLELVSISPQRLREVARPCLPYLDMLVINEYELGALADMPVTDNQSVVDDERLVAAGKSVMDSGSMQLLVAHHPGGAVALHREAADQPLHVLKTRSFAIPEDFVKGSVGAGDAFAAGVLYGVQKGWPVEQALELAHAVAAASLRAADAVSAVETASECLAFARQYGRCI